MPILNSFYGSGSGGGNIGEPLNLTVTSAGLDATITWEDNEIGTIPPTTFQKSELVRKIGSAPNSPSDGDLVVTETVKDTYKVSGYVDQGLTDGTTYYYRVFSYSDLGGISYCDAESVTIRGSWQPGVNTIAYFPLNSVSEEADQIGTWTYSSGGKPTFGTYTSANVDCGSFDSNTGMQYTGSMPMTGIFTFSFWAYSTWTSGDDGKAIDMDNSNDSGKRIAISYWSGRYQYYISSYSIDSSGLLVVPNNSWHYITAIADGTTMYFYVDGLLSHSINYSYSSTTLNGFNIGNQIWNGLSRHWMGYLSEIIIEDKAWTQQEITDYYNLTKGDYGIS